jgi:hypothetical protein
MVPEPELLTNFLGFSHEITKLSSVVAGVPYAKRNLESDDEEVEQQISIWDDVIDPPIILLLINTSFPYNYKKKDKGKKQNRNKQKKIKPWTKAAFPPNLQFAQYVIILSTNTVPPD